MDAFVNSFCVGAFKDPDPVAYRRDFYVSNFNFIETFFGDIYQEVEFVY